MESKKYCVYKLTCRHNGRVYIGITCQKPELRWRKGKAYRGDLRMDIEQYGWEEGFKKEILEKALDYENAALAEKRYVALLSNTTDLYNSTVGGEVLSDEAIAAKAEKQKGRRLSLETRKKIGEARRGAVFSEEHIRRLSESHKGNPGFWSGKTRDRKTAEKISKKLSIPIKCIETGEIYANLKEASEKTGYSISCISKWCNGVKPRKCKYTFERMN